MYWSQEGAEAAGHPAREVLERAPDNDQRGKVVLGFQVKNQHGQTVAIARARYLIMLRRPD